MITRNNTNFGILEAYSIAPNIKFKTDNGFIHLTLDAFELFEKYQAQMGQTLITSNNENWIVIGGCAQHLWFKHPTQDILVKNIDIPDHLPISLTEKRNLPLVRAFFFNLPAFVKHVEELNISKYKFHHSFPIAKNEKSIGNGHYGKIYLKEFNGKTHACKVVNRKNKIGYSQELRIMSFMRDIIPANNYLLKFYGFSILSNHEQILLEYVNGGDLTNFLDDDKRYQLNACPNIILQVAKGLELLDIHDIVHCDIKSTNILVTKSGEAKLADFGLSRVQSELVEKGSVIGTAPYIAPEIISYYSPFDPTGEKNRADNNPLRSNNHQTDIYAFGLVIWELLTRQPLFDDIADTSEFLSFIKAPENLPKHSVTANDPAPKRKMASLYQWCCLFDPNQRPSATDVVSECELGDAISDRLLPFSPK